MDALILFPVMFLAMWLLFVRPQQRRVRQQQQLLSALQAGDEVVTSSGMIGTISAVGDDELVVEVSPGVHVRLLRGAVARRISADEYEDDEEGDEPPVAEIDLADEAVTVDDRDVDDRS